MSDPTRNPLFDIAPPCAIITIGGKEYKVTGVSLRILTALFKSHPKIMGGFLFGGKLDGAAVLQEGAEVTEAIIAAGVGAPDDESAKKWAANLPLPMQLDLIAAIFRETTGGGVGPFVEKIKAIQAVVGVVAEDPRQAPEAPETVRKFRLKQAVRASPQPSNLSPTNMDLPTANYGT